MAIKIMVDSASDITQKEAEQLGIYMIPMSITFGLEEFYDGVDILPENFYEKLIENREMPKTSQVSEYRFVKELTPIVESGNEVILITLSSKLSATFNSAKKASEKFNGKVFVVDSMSAAAGERLLVEYALQLIEQGKTAQEIAQELNNVKSKLCVMAVVDTLEYLRKGGRISFMVAFTGKMLAIKPVVAIIDGKVKMIGKALGSKKGNNLLNKTVQEKGGIDFSMPYGVLWTGLDESIADDYIKQSPSVFSEGQVNKYILGSTIGTHVGPGVVGVAFFSKEEQ